MKIPIGGWTCAIMTANKSRNISGIKARANRERRIFFSDPPTKLVHSDKIAQSSFAISHFGPTKITKEENPSGRNYFSFREFNFHVTYKVSVNSCAPLLISIGRASNITIFFFSILFFLPFDFFIFYFRWWKRGGNFYDWSIWQFRYCIYLQHNFIFTIQYIRLANIEIKCKSYIERWQGLRW